MLTDLASPPSPIASEVVPLGDVAEVLRHLVCEVRHLRTRERVAEPELIDRRELARLLGISKATLDRMASAGRTPRPLALSAGAVRWRLATVRNWLAESERAGRLLDCAEWEALSAASTPRLNGTARR